MRNPSFGPTTFPSWSDQSSFYRYSRFIKTRIARLADKAKYDHDGSLELPFSQTEEDLCMDDGTGTGSTIGVCFSLCLMWLRKHLAKEGNQGFYAWLRSTDPTYIGRNPNKVRMKKWMIQQRFGNRFRFYAQEYQQVRQQPAPSASLQETQQYLRQQYDHATHNLVAMPNYPGFDKSYLKMLYNRGTRNPLQRTRYDLNQTSQNFSARLLAPGHLRTLCWTSSPIPADAIGHHQLSASKITRHADASHHFSPETDDCLFYFTCINPTGNKFTEIGNIIGQYIEKYQRKRNHHPVLALIGTDNHQMAVYVEASPGKFSSGSLYFFDPNFGIFKFSSLSRHSRFDNLGQFFAMLMNEPEYRNELSKLSLSLFSSI